MKDMTVFELSWNKERSLGDLVSGMKNKLGLDNDTPAWSTPQGSGLVGAMGGSVEAIATGGTRSTNVTINVGNMVETMNFNREDMGDNLTDMEGKVLDIFLRVLNMSNSAAR